MNLTRLLSLVPRKTIRPTRAVDSTVLCWGLPCTNFVQFETASTTLSSITIEKYHGRIRNN